MNKLEDIRETISDYSNLLIVKDIEKFRIESIIGYRIDDLIIDGKYQNTKALADFLLKILPNMTIAGVVRCKIYYCSDLNDITQLV